MRVLEVEWDDQRECFNPWRSDLQGLAHQGPSASLALAKHKARQQQSPTASFKSWARSRHVAPSDRTYHEMLVLMEALQRFGCRGQLNLGASAGLETLVRRAQAHDRPGERPDCDLAPYLGAAASSDPRPRDLRSWAAWRAKDKAETERHRTRVRGASEEAREDQSGAEAGAETEGSWCGGRGRVEGLGGRGRGGSRRQAKLGPRANRPASEGRPPTHRGIWPQPPRTADSWGCAVARGGELADVPRCNAASVSTSCPFRRVLERVRCAPDGAPPQDEAACALLRGSVGYPRDAADTTVAPCEFSRRLAT